MNQDKRFISDDEVIYSEFFSMTPKYHITVGKRFYSDVEVLIMLSLPIFGDTWNHIKNILRIRKYGIIYSHEDFDVLSSAIGHLERSEKYRGIV